MQVEHVDITYCIAGIAGRPKLFYQRIVYLASTCISVLSSPFLYAEEIVLTVDNLPFVGRINGECREIIVNIPGYKDLYFAKISFAPAYGFCDYWFD